MKAVKLENRYTRPGVKRKKSVKSMIFSYTVLGAILVLVVFMIALMVCGVLYIREHLAHTPDNSVPLPTENVATGAPVPTETPVIPATPDVPDKMIVVLDAGHGGVQPGCVIDGVLEKEITLSIVFLLQKKLEAEDITVILTRDSDEDISLADRSKIANDAGASYFVSIHCNSFDDDSSVKGLECYYYQSDEGRAMADAITSSAVNHQISTRRVKEENYAVVRNTLCPAVLIEVGFMTNEQELAQLMSPEYQELLAEAIAEGVLNYDKQVNGGR